MSGVCDATKTYRTLNSIGCNVTLLIDKLYIHDADLVTHKMTTEGIQLFIAFLPLYTVGNGIDRRRSMFASICIEEMADNIVDYGFDDGKKHFVNVRVIVKDKQVIVRIRDDCRSFDPKKWAEIHNPDDSTAHIGIRLVKKIATEFNYVNVLKLNNLIIKL